MESLRAYLKSLTKEERETFARACNTSVAMLFQIAGGHRRAGESLAINIERESASAVLCESLRPDVDWAFLRQTVVFQPNETGLESA